MNMRNKFEINSFATSKVVLLGQKYFLKSLILSGVMDKHSSEWIVKMGVKMNPSKILLRST